MQLRPQERRLIALIRAVRWGEITIKVQDGLPILAIEIRRMVKLDREPNESATKNSKNPERPMSSAQFTDICPKPLDKWGIFSYIIDGAGKPLFFHPLDAPWAIIRCVCAFLLEVGCVSKVLSAMSLLS